MSSICSGVVRLGDRLGSSCRAKNATSLVSSLGGRCRRQLAEEEELVDGLGVAGPVAPAIIMDRRQFERAGGESRLLGDFAHHAFGRD